MPPVPSPPAIVRSWSPTPLAAGPGGVLRRVNRERVLLVGWGRAVLLQLAHPLVVAGVAGHSRALAGPGRRLLRLHRTQRALLALTFGGPEEAARAARPINAAHARVRGRLEEPGGRFAAGTPYAAADPDLLRWVYATTVDSFLRTYELFVESLSAEERDCYCAEAARLAPLLGLPPGLAPTSAAELRGYLDGALAGDEIAVTRTARRLARELLAAPVPGAWPLAWAARLATAGLLPGAVRDAYGLPWGQRRQVALRLAAVASRRLLPALPARVRYWPAAHLAAERSGPARAD